MYISKVSLINYRNFRNAKFHFNKGINTVIGENGSGKTNLFKAIRLLLDDNSLQYAYKLSESDFNRTLGKEGWKGHWIIISLEFEEINSEEAIQSLFIHGAGVLEEEFVKKASYTLFLRPKADIRQKLSELQEGDNEGLSSILGSLTINDNYETYFTGKSTADFNDSEVYKELVGDFEKVIFPATIDASKFGSRIPHQLSISKEVSFTFIQALRDVVGDFRSNKTNPLLTLLRNKSGEIKEEDYEPISNLVKELNNKIEDLDDVQNIRTDIQSTIQNAVGQTYSPSSLSIRSNVPGEADKLLQSLKLYIGEPDESHEGGIEELSLGGANLIFLTLKLLEFSYRKAKDKFANFLIIEEPEAHIHNHIQKTLFDKLDYNDTQIIYSTHSTQISEVSNVENINILAKKMNYAEAFHPSNGLTPSSIMQVQRYLDAVRTNLLFAKGVMLVEGDAEEILIPQMVKKVFGVSLDELGISLVNIRSTGFENVAQLFHNDRIRRKCSILTDLDIAICDTNIIDSDDDSIKAYKKKLANSQKNGESRFASLTFFTLGNAWINAFYATHTFEVDFLRAGNFPEVHAIVDDTYTDAGTRSQAKVDLNSNDVAVCGKRILTMAKQKGKGWFAILLSNKITSETIIPDYIIKAIAFSKDSYSNHIIADIINYRINGILEYETTKDFSACLEALNKYKRKEVTIHDIIPTIEEAMPDDQLIVLLKSVSSYVLLA